MKKITTALAAAAAVAIMASCAASNVASTEKALNGEWNVAAIDGQSITVPEGQDAPFIGFKTAEKQVYGSTSCNRLTGGLNADMKKKTIDFGVLGSTRMMCKDMALEDKLLNALGKVDKFDIEKGRGGDQLLLLDESGKAVVTLSRKAN